VFECNAYRISFVSIQKLTHDGQNVIVQSTDDHANISVCHMKLSSRLIASALYRDMTEMYYFYRCDTVSSEVLTQYCRDLKGIVASVFNENTDIGIVTFHVFKCYCNGVKCILQTTDF
jgi:E3 ubiquitin-protein ligase MYLIP